MSFFDNFSIVCKNCTHVIYLDKIKIKYDIECPKCGKRWIIEFRKDRNYVNGCTIGPGTL